MSKKISLDQAEFDGLLNWFSPNREEAGKRYESVRQGLTRYFRFKGCSNEEDLADETINRVARKLPKLDLSAGNQPITIFFGFASKMFLEELKRTRKEIDIETKQHLHNPIDDTENIEIQFDCLEECLNKLGAGERELVTDYYSKNKSEKFEYRRNIAAKRDISMNNLHVKVHRLRHTLRICVEGCLSKNSL
ncbi:MAG: hypothetical protein ACKVQW_08160 [Pyrinomonadaceae bacterium]